ncbi:MAG: TIGR02452 family protein, partial [Planctomycetota bacterium]
MVDENRGLEFLPCLDSEEMAAARRAELEIPREQAAALGVSAVEAAETGAYLDEAGRRVEWGPLVARARDAKRSIPPDEALPEPPPKQPRVTRVQVTNETTLGAAHRLVRDGRRPLALNFANGIQPGGGFLGGARAQEESLCRSSALFETLVGDPMYEYHLGRPTEDSTTWAIVSPDVPVFRADDGTPRAQPWSLSFLTCAAPYAPDIGRARSADLLGKRIRRVLAIAAARGYEALVLGAWGCGVFGNDPARTARDFRSSLETDFRGVFAEVVFAVVD